MVPSRLLPHTTELFSRQYGFQKGKSTTDAIVKLKKIATETTEKYSIGIFADIKGAFDRVWWPGALGKLLDIHCPGNLYKLLQNYFSDRKVIITEQHSIVTRIQNRGCPQGSVLGPLMWCLTFDSPLDELAQIQNCEPIAFADDLAIIITGKSRAQLENIAQRAINTLELWCSNHKMTLSKNKTEAMLLKGNLDEERPPRLTLLNGPLKFKASVKYLGVMIDRKFKFTSHPTYVAEKAKGIIINYAKFCRLKWGVSHRAMSTIYRGAIVPIMAYASYVWVDHINSKTQPKLNSAHRYALIRATKAYSRTTSTAALEIVANIQPIMNEIQIEKLRYCIRKSLPCTIHGTNYETNQQDAKESMQQLKSNLLAKWQQDWSRSTWGRNTMDYFPTVRDRQTKPWVIPSYFMTQILTGHGNFLRYLAVRQLTQSDQRSCGTAETATHVVYNCRKFNRERQLFINKLVMKGYIWPAKCSDLTNEDIYCEFEKFVITIMEIKEREGT